MPPPTSPPPAWMLSLIPLFFTGLWVGVLHLLSRVGGWRRLAIRHPAREAPKGPRLILRTASLGGVHYNNCLTFIAGEKGLYIKVPFPLRPGHAPLFLPWEDMKLTAHRGWFLRHVDVSFVSEPGLRLRMRDRLAHALFGRLLHASAPSV